MLGPTRRGHYPLFARLRFAFAFPLLLFLVVPHTAVCQDRVDPFAFDQATVGALPPDIRSFSGSPLLLQVIIQDPDRLLRQFVLASDTSTLSYRIPPDHERDELVLHLSPFFGPGRHELELQLETHDSVTTLSRFEVGFVDFVWGRDNLSFGNNEAYKSVIGTFGEILAEWIAARFGTVADADLVLLVDFMYSLFGTNTGRCYAFSGTEVRYWRWPELLPAYYGSAHDIRGTVARHQREMNYLQFDIVFDYFVTRGAAEDFSQPMTREQILEQALEIESRIAAGVPVAVGFGGPGFHHSMLVFGYIHNPARQTIDLLVANNWKSDEKLNIHSEDAEMVRLYLSPCHEGGRMEWRYADGLRTSVMDRLITLDVRREEYVHNRDFLDSLIAGLRETLQTEGKVMLVVEEAAGVRLVAGDRSTGRVHNREVREIAGVEFEYTSRVYRFSYPPGLEVALEIVDDLGARVYFVEAGAGDKPQSAHISRTTAAPYGTTVTKRVSLSPDALTTHPENVSR